MNIDLSGKTADCQRIHGGHWPRDRHGHCRVRCGDHHQWPQAGRSGPRHRDHPQEQRRKRNCAASRATSARREGCDALAKAVPQADILVNNLGIFGPGDLFTTEDDDWERYFQVNVMSGVRLTRHYLKGMMERKWGRVVFISSESALNIPPDMLAYGFSKTAQLSIARGIAKQVAGSGVTVNSVLPGPTLSDGFRSMVEDTAKEQGKTVEQVATEFVREHRSSSIIQRAATTEEVANMVVYVCSPQASATTGAALRVDGGVIDTIA